MAKGREAQARMAAGFFVVGGILTVATVPLQTATSNGLGTAAVGIAATLTGIIVWHAPWQRWPQKASLWLVPVGLAMIGLGNHLQGTESYVYGIFFILVFVWIGISHPPGTSMWMLVPTTVAVGLPFFWLPEDPASKLAATIITVSVCVVVGESLASVVKRLDESRALLAASSAKFRAVSDHALDAIVSADSSGTIVYANTAAADIFGRPSSAMVGTRLSHLIPERFREAHETGLHRDVIPVSLESPGRVIEFVGLREDGEEFPMEVSVSMWETSEGVFHTEMIRDLTERKRAQSLERERDAIERSATEKREFLSRMSHELRTPLNAILGFGQLLEMDDLSEEQRESVAQILGGGHNLLALVDEVLEIVDLETADLRFEAGAIGVHDVLAEIAASARPMAANRGVTISIDCPEGLRVTADPQGLRQVVLNLVSNGINYNLPNGRVIADARDTASGIVRISITDTGPGISPENLERVFSPFERLHASGSGVDGTGLGLTVSRSLVTAMGGRMGVNSVIGAGSTFWIDLPNADTVGRAGLEPATEGL